MISSALIIAGGKKETANEFEPLHPLGFLSAIQRLILTFRKAEAQDIVVVYSSEQKGIEKEAARLGATLLYNANAETMLDNIKFGLQFLQNKCDAVWITPVDVPLFKSETVKKIFGSDETAAIPLYKESAGHPLWLSTKVVPDILNYKGNGGLKKAMQVLDISSTKIQTEDPGILYHVYEEEDWQSLVNAHDLQKIRPEIKVRLARERLFFGPGTAQLLRLINYTHSVREACSYMGLSYSKGWKMLSNLEAQFAQPVVERRQGGKQGGYAELTIRGAKLLNQYIAYEKACKKAADELFQKYFEEM